MIWDSIVNWFVNFRWTPETISVCMIMSGVIGFPILEHFFPYTKGIPYFRKGYWIDLVWYTWIQSFFLKILIFDYIIVPGEHALGMAEQGYLSHWPVWALLLFFFVIHDFYIYWFHRLQHSSKWLWRTHEAHHSVEQVDWLAGSRSNVVEIIINQTIEFAPIFFLLDVQTAAIIVPLKAGIDAMWGQFIHANLNVKLGKLGYIINGPEHHQWHHADQIEVYHANFATKLAIWDWLFGTMYLPDKKPLKFGLWYRFPRDYFMQHLFSLVRFNVEKVEKNPVINAYLNIRINMINGFRSGWSRLFSPKKKYAELNGKAIFEPKPELAEADS